MPIFIADHTGTLRAEGSFLRPIHIGAALSIGPLGPNPDTEFAGNISDQAHFADIRVYDYIDRWAAAHGAPEFVAIMQYRRYLMLPSGGGFPASLNTLLTMRQDTVMPYVINKMSETQWQTYLAYLAEQSDQLLGRELGNYTFLANRIRMNKKNLAEQYLTSIAKDYPGDPAYIAIWHDMIAVAEHLLGKSRVAYAIGLPRGYYNNMFVTRWQDFAEYKSLLWRIFDELDAYKTNFRIFGYLAERIFSIYLAARFGDGIENAVSNRPIYMPHINPVK